MLSDVLQSLLVVMALIGALLLVRFNAGTKAATKPSSAAQLPRVLAAPEARSLAPAPPTLGREGLATLSPPTADTAERRRPRLTVVEARRGIVLATILEPCRAHRAEEPWETERIT
jgi:hypothetical protein